MFILMTLTLMQGYSGSVKAKNQRCMPSATEQAISIKLATTVGHFMWPWLCKCFYGLSILLQLDSVPGILGLPFLGKTSSCKCSATTLPGVCSLFCRSTCLDVGRFCALSYRGYIWQKDFADGFQYGCGFFFTLGVIDTCLISISLPDDTQKFCLK